jgi:hypothetical protein
VVALAPSTWFNDCVSKVDASLRPFLFVPRMFTDVFEFDTEEAGQPV